MKGETSVEGSADQDPLWAFLAFLATCETLNTADDEKKSTVIRVVLQRTSQMA